MNKKNTPKFPKNKRTKIPKTDTESSDYTNEIVGKDTLWAEDLLDFKKIQKELDKTLTQKSKKQE